MAVNRIQNNAGRCIVDVVKMPKRQIKHSELDYKVLFISARIRQRKERHSLGRELAPVQKGATLIWGVLFADQPPAHGAHAGG